jgi:hypothetical protein
VNFYISSFDKRMTARTYCLLLLMATFFLMVAMMAFNFYVDPFDIRDRSASFRLSGFRSEPDKNERIFKLVTVARVRPGVLVLGTSRAAHGIDPDHPQLKELASSRFNAAFDGANVAEIVSVFKYLAGLSSVPHFTIIGLDFMAFADCSSKNDNNRIAKIIDGLPPGDLAPPAQLARISSSLDTVRASIRTLQNDGAIAFHHQNGRRLDHVFEERIKERGGYGANFKKLEADFFRLYLVDQAKCFYLASEKNKAFEAFRELLSTAYASGTDLRMFVSPIHARQLEVIRLSGLWDQYETWLRRMVNISESEASALGREPFPIVDFSSFEGLTAKPILERQDESSAIAWYWESSHYKKSLGDLVVGKIFGGHLSADSRDLPSVLLTKKSVGAHLSQIREAERKYAMEQPDVLGQLVRTRCEVVKEGKSCI